MRKKTIRISYVSRQQTKWGSLISPYANGPHDNPFSV